MSSAERSPNTNPISLSSPAIPPRRSRSAALRTQFRVPFVGTVPAIKPACAQSQRKRVAVLGTQATVGREYTRALIREFASGCDVHLVGSPRLATYAEAELAGAPVADRGDQDRNRALLHREGPAGAPTPSCSPARIIRCCSNAFAAARLAGRLARSGAGDCAARRRPDARRARPATRLRHRASSLLPGAHLHRT